MKQIDNNLGLQVEAKSDIQHPGAFDRTQEVVVQSMSHSGASNPLKKTPTIDWLRRVLTLTIATSVSATIGLAAALLIPLPMGLVAKNKSAASDLWQIGLGYWVGRPVNILVMGIDQVPNAPEDSKEIFAGRSDTMLLLRVDPVSDTVSLLSIPRDTQVDIPGVGVDKINDANVRGGATLAARTVSANLNGVTIDRYVRVSTDAFKELIDLLGGVEVHVPKRMVYEDKTQKLKIDLSPGLQTLSGAQAEQFARFRQDDLGDIGRVQRQQTLLKALRKKLMNPTVIPRIPSLIQAMRKYIDTNLTKEEMLALVGAGRKLSEGDFKMVMLPGRFSSPDEFVASYWIMDPIGRDRVMQQYFGVDPLSVYEADGQTTAVRIAIQNASHNPDAAYRMRQHLATLGFDDVYISEDWAQPQDKTQVIPQRGDLSRAEELQRSLGFGQVEANSTGDLESDITIRVGDDWQPKKAHAGK